VDLAPRVDRVNERYRACAPGLVEQTAILRDVEIPEVLARERDHATVSFTRYEWLIVLTQDCDLQFDRLARARQSLTADGPPVKRDKLLRGTLVCPAFKQDHILAGTYVDEGTKWGGDERKILLRNQADRYHVLPAEGPLVPEPIILDFKLIVTVHPAYLGQWVERNPVSLIAVLNAPFRDRLTQRFVNYFGRIAEPEAE